MRNSWNRSSEKCNVVLCGMNNINLTKESIKNLGVHISYNMKIHNDLNFCKTIKILSKCYIITLWRMRKLFLEGEITMFKSLAISKIDQLAIITKIPNIVIEELKQIQKNFCGITKKQKLHKTLYAMITKMVI